MATKRKKISELTPATSLAGLWTIGVDGSNKSVKIGLTWLKDASDGVAAAIVNAGKAATAANTAAGNANKAATDAGAAMSQISAEVSKLIMATNTAKDAAITATTNADNATTAANTAARLATEAKEDTVTATGLAIDAAELAGQNAGLANTAAGKANTSAGNADKATSDAVAATSAANTATTEANTARDNANTATELANTAAESANTAAENVKDGKTPALGIGTVQGGESASASVDPDGEDVTGNPKYKINLTLPKGDSGLPPVLEQGTVTTGEPGTDVIASLVTNGFTVEGNPKYLLNLTIPRGLQGLPGTGTGNVFVSGTGLVSGKKYVFVPDADDSTTGAFVEYTDPVPYDDAEVLRLIGNKVEQVPGKQLTTEDFTTLLKQKLEGLSNYNDATLTSELNSLKTRLDALIGTSASAAIDTFNEITAFLAGVTDTQNLTTLLSDLRTSIVALIPNVPSWALAAQKPTYTASEVGAVNVTGGTMTGPLKISTEPHGGQLEIHRKAANANSVIKHSNLDGILGYIGIGGGSSINPDNPVFVDKDSKNTYKIWHSGNDGAGSGLDADTLDGLHSNQFMYVSPKGIGAVQSDDTDYTHCGFGYVSDGWPTDGSYISFGGLTRIGSHVTQIQANYDYGRSIYFRTKNDDAANRWNPWRQLAIQGEAQPASDVYAWAKAATKPAYTPSEIGALYANGKAIASATSDKLSTPRTIQGVAFDGTANINLPIATDSASGLMSTDHYKILKRMSSVETLNNTLNVPATTANNFVVSLSTNTTIAISGAATYTGQELFIVVNPTAAVTIVIPTSGSYVSMCGSSYTCTAGKQVEFSIKYVDGKWRIAKIEQE